MHGSVKLARKEEDRAPPARREDDIDFRQVVEFVLRRWKLIVFATLVVIALTGVVLLALMPRYTATTQVLLEPKKEIFGSDSILPEFNLDTGNVDSQIWVISSFNLLRRVAEKFQLDQDSEFGKAGEPGLIGLLKRLAFGAETRPEGSQSVQNPVSPALLRAIRNLGNALQVNRVARTYVLSISVTSEEAGKAMRLANGVADAYVVDRLDARYEAAKRASAWLAQRIEGLKEQVRLSEEAVATFREEHKLTVSSEGTVGVGEQQLAELNGKLASARSDVAEKRAKFEQAQKIERTDGNLEAIPDVVRSTVISDLRKQEAEVKRKEADLVSRYSNAHPMVINVRAELTDVERSIAAEVSRIIINLKNDYDVAAAREESLQSSIDALTGRGGPDGSIGVKLRELERVNQANKTLFEDFLSRAKLTQEQTAFEEREARIISPAIVPEAPSFPRKSLILGIAGVFGAGLGIAGALALDMLNSGFRTPEELETVLDRPVLSSVMLLSDSQRRIDGKIESPIGLLQKRPLSRFAEQVRTIRVGVQMSDVDHPPNIVLLTSSVPKEGKSTLSACLAFSAAKSGQRVLLIDGDLRHSATTKHFGLEGRSGLVDHLTGATSLEQVLVACGPIVVLPAGSATQNPGDLLGSARMRQMTNSLREVFDYIVIDSPPVAPVIDAKLLTQLADKIIYVVRWQSTPREIAMQCLGQLAGDRKHAGVVLNLVNERKAPSYRRYWYYSRKYYSGYYQQ